ncbi:hypothetical protein M422DRAFT_780407 [Sphaerobolus stellatus SS14]|uniref:DUF6534 domain-containing protein n=1 Tax=Sphaerobolus stellatus (strain SS14) TaxID=990650 RepID=A0A0C9VIE4_SPHS4|nr:hypothetical protein M422DRAFT_780407 [Sphaerobolus stellatus SS14]
MDSGHRSFLDSYKRVSLFLKISAVYKHGMKNTGVVQPYDVKSLYGPALVGLVLSAFLSGLVTLQTFQYYRNYPKDSIPLKIYVFVLLLLNMAHLVIIFLFVYYYTVLHWGDLSVINRLTWAWSAQFITTSVIIALCHCYFIRRVFFLSEKKLCLVVILTILATLQVGMSIWLSVYGLNGQTILDFLETEEGARARLLGISIASISSAALCHTLIVGATVWYLKSYRTKWNQGLLDKILVYIVCTGAPTSLCVYLTLSTLAAFPTKFVYLIFIFPICLVYSKSILLSLNARHAIQNTEMPTWFSTTTLALDHIQAQADDSLVRNIIQSIRRDRIGGSASRITVPEELHFRNSGLYSGHLSLCPDADAPDIKDCSE